MQHGRQVRGHFREKDVVNPVETKVGEDTGPNRDGQQYLEPRNLSLQLCLFISLVRNYELQFFA